MTSEEIALLDGEILKIEQFINPTTGFFTHMDYDFEFMSKEELDILFWSTYGEKNPAPLVMKMLSYVPTELELSKLASITKSMHLKKWDRLKAVVALDYDPIHNYKDVLTESIEETGQDDVIETLTSEATKAVTNNRTVTRTDDLTNSTVKSLDSTINSDTDDGIYGFNSSEVSNSDKSTTSESRNDELTNVESSTGTQTNVTVDTESVTDNKSNDNSIITTTSNNKTRTSTHSGNIGNLTTQQLIQKEIELWSWMFIEAVLTDVKDFLTIPIYLS